MCSEAQKCAAWLPRHNTPRDRQIEIFVVDGLEAEVALFTNELMLPKGESCQGHGGPDGGAGRPTQGTSLGDQAREGDVVAGRDEGRPIDDGGQRRARSDRRRWRGGRGGDVGFGRWPVVQQDLLYIDHAAGKALWRRSVRRGNESGGEGKRRGLGRKEGSSGIAAGRGDDGEREGVRLGGDGWHSRGIEEGLVEAEAEVYHTPRIGEGRREGWAGRCSWWRAGNGRSVF